MEKHGLGMRLPTVMLWDVSLTCLVLIVLLALGFRTSQPRPPTNALNSSSLVWWSQTLVHTHLWGCVSGCSLVDLTGKAAKKWRMELLWDALIFLRKSLKSCLILCISVPKSWKRCLLCPRTVGVHCLLIHECGLYSEYPSGLSLYSPTMQSKNSHLQTWLIFSPYDWVCWSGCDSMSVPTTWKGYLLCPRSVGVHCVLAQGVWALQNAVWDYLTMDWGRTLTIRLGCYPERAMQTDLEVGSLKWLHQAPMHHPVRVSTTSYVILPDLPLQIITSVKLTQFSFTLTQ